MQSVRANYSTVINAFGKELEGSGSGVGYRRVTKALTDQGIICKIDDVCCIIKALALRVFLFGKGDDCIDGITFPVDLTMHGILMAMIN